MKFKKEKMCQRENQNFHTFFNSIQQNNSMEKLDEKDDNSKFIQYFALNISSICLHNSSK